MPKHLQGFLDGSQVVFAMKYVKDCVFVDLLICLDRDRGADAIGVCAMFSAWGQFAAHYYQQRSTRSAGNLLSVFCHEKAHLNGHPCPTALAVHRIAL